jgi:hypothetical protein
VTSDRVLKSLAPARADAGIWRALLVLGAVLGGLGGLELAALWLPPVPRTPEGVFGTTSAFFAGFPQLALGLVFVLGAAVALGNRGMARAVAILCVLISLALWLVGSLYLDALPYMLQVASRPAVHWQVRRLTVQAGLEAFLYPLLLVLLAVRGWRATLSYREG